MNATQSHARLLREIADRMASQDHLNAASDIRFAADELDRLDKLINSPHTSEFLEAVRHEAAHQRERWGSEHDEGKHDRDWFWLLGYLAGKALNSAGLVESVEAFKGEAMTTAWATFAQHHREKALHHIITTAAVCLNWHAARAGVDTRMRPGIATPRT